MEEDWLTYFQHLILNFKLLGFIVYLLTMYITERKLSNSSNSKKIVVFLLLFLEAFVIGYGEIVASGFGNSYFRQVDLSRNFDSITHKRTSKKILLKYHPDRSTSNLDKEILGEIFAKKTHILDHLKSSSKRDLYDRFGYPESTQKNVFDE